MNNLTICSVSYHSAPYLYCNKALLKGEYDRWLVVQNGPQENLACFDVIEGEPQPKPKPGFVGYASYHHGMGLNKALPLIKTRYVLFLDPDFFVVPDLGFCIEHMKYNELVAFGAPYPINPSRPRIQNVPTAFCMFIDLEKVDKDKLNFIPENYEKIVADTGYHVYNYLKTLKIEAVVPSYVGKSEYPNTKKRLQDLVNVSDNYDSYFWNDNLFGVHCHMKLHLRENDEKALKNRTSLHLTEVCKVINKVRK